MLFIKCGGIFFAHICDYCGEMNGQVFPESKRKIGENAPPFHPWCRCTTAPYFEDMKGVGTRWMRDPETGKGGYVPADMTYQEWKAILLTDRKIMVYTILVWLDEGISIAEWNKEETEQIFPDATNLVDRFEIDGFPWQTTQILRYT